MEGGEGQISKEIPAPRFQILRVSNAQFNEQRARVPIVSSGIINASTGVTDAEHSFLEAGALPCMLYFSYNHRLQQGISGHFTSFMNTTQMEHMKAKREPLHRKMLSKVFELTPRELIKATPLFGKYREEVMEQRYLYGYKHYKHMLEQVREWQKDPESEVETYIFGGNVSDFSETEDIARMQEYRTESVRDFSELGGTVWDMRPDLHDLESWGIGDSILAVPKDKLIYLQRSRY